MLFDPHDHAGREIRRGEDPNISTTVPDDDTSEYRRYPTRDKIGKRTSKALFEHCYVGLGKHAERMHKVAYIEYKPTHEENVERLQTLYDLGVGEVTTRGKCSEFKYGDNEVSVTKTLYFMSKGVDPILYLFKWEDLHTLEVYEELQRWYDKDKIVCLAGGDPYEVLGRMDFNRVKQIRKEKLKAHKELVEKNRQARHQRKLWKAKTRKLKRQQRLMERVRNGDVGREDIIESMTTKTYLPDESKTSNAWLAKRKETYSSLKDDKKVYSIVVDYIKGKVDNLQHAMNRLWWKLPYDEKYT